MVANAVRVRPSVSPATRNREIPWSVQAATMTSEAVCPSSTYILVPLNDQPSPLGVATMVIPSLPQRPLSSVKARVAIVSPAAMPGSSSALASSSPEWMSVLAASTTVEKNGAHNRDRPISSRTTINST